MKQLNRIYMACLLIGYSQAVFAVSEQDQSKIHRWQMQQIYQPSQYLLDRERRGFVNIYDGFTDAQVDQVMDQKFDRLNSMMFTRVKITDAAGDVLKDASTGEEMIEDDGCD